MRPSPGTAEAAVLGAAVQKTVQGLEQLRLVQHKRVVPVIGSNLDKADLGCGSVKRVHNLPTFRGRKQPIAGERDYAETRAGALECAGQRSAVFRRQVKIIHRAGDVAAGVRVEADDKGPALVAQIALYLEIDVEPIGDGEAILASAPKLTVQGRVGQ